MKARYRFTLAPASALWLLTHEARLRFYSAGTGFSTGAKTRRGMGRGSVIWWTLLMLMLHAGAGFVMSGMTPMIGAAPLKLKMLMAGLLAIVFMLMLSMGLKASVEALFERGDLDLLLSSPLSSRSIFCVRLVAVVLSVAGIFLFFLAPFAHAGVLFGQARWLSIYPVFVSMALIAASMAMSLTLGLVKLFGVRRTRVIAQVLGGLAGAAIFLVSQLYSGFGESMQGRVHGIILPLFQPGAVLGPGSVAWLPGQALLGEPRPMLGMAVIGLAVFWLTIHFTHAFFVRGVGQSAHTANQAQLPVRALKFHFRRSLQHSILLKEWRLIARDPQLISQTLLPLLYLLPAFGLIVVGQDTRLPGIASGMTFLCGSLTTALAWIIINAEDAPDLLLAAPVNPNTIARAKLAAALILPLTLSLPGLAWIATSRPAAALVLTACVAGSVTSAGLIALWCGRPSARGQFKLRAKGNLITSTLETCSGLAWAGVAFLGMKGLADPGSSGHLMVWAALGLSVAAGIVCLAWVMRRQR